MTLVELLWVFGLAFGQVGVLVAAKQLAPELYFASAQFFVTRGEFKWKAILFRLAVPFTAGFLVPVLPGVESERLVAVSTGFFAWFLILWPIAWAPRLMIPQLSTRSVRLIVLLWLLWWLFFTLLPVSGAALTAWIRSVLSDPDSSWWEAQLAGQLFLLIPVSVIAFAATKLIDKEVPRLGDELFDDAEDDSSSYAGYEHESMSWWSMDADEWRYRARQASTLAIPLLLIALIVAFLRRVRRV